MRSREIPDVSDGEHPGVTEIGVTAALHGRELLQQGFTVDQVVHDYGDLCQAVTELAFEDGAAIKVDEFRTLNRCLDNAIADAVTEFSSRRDSSMAGEERSAVKRTSGISGARTAKLCSYGNARGYCHQGRQCGLNGETGAVLDRSLIGLRNLIDRSLADVRVTAGLPARPNGSPLRTSSPMSQSPRHLRRGHRNATSLFRCRQGNCGGCGSGHALVGRWKLASKCVQVHEAPYGSHIERPGDPRIAF